MTNNQVTLVGRISSELTHDHEIYGENYYRVTVSVERTSGVYDDIPVLVSDRLFNIRELKIDSYILVRGQYRSYNLHENLKTRLLLFVVATELEIISYSDSYNEVFLEGYITKPPVYRQTPLGREICDVILGIHRGYNKTDYIPCVIWGKNAKYISKFEVGDVIRVAGRLQSRNYDKAGETKTAYEVSVNLVEVLDDSDEVA